jgi:hypothetical protein
MVPDLKGEANARIIPFKIKDNTFNHSNVSNHIPSLQRSALPFKGVPTSRTKFSTFGATCLVYLHHVFYSSPFYIDIWGNDLYPGNF